MMPETQYAHPPWRLSELLNGLAEIVGKHDPIVQSLCLDSTAVKQGSVFIALQGVRRHGVSYIGEVLSRGAAAVLCEPSSTSGCELESLKIPLVEIPDLRQKLGIISDRFFHHPSRDMTVIAVTGTDGKTSVSQFIAQALSGKNICGVIGTLGYGLPGQLVAGSHTTPDSIRLHSELALLRDHNVTHVVIEASSHGLHQGRLNGVAIDIAVLTNLSRDHLDYHGNLQAYAQAKRMLFQMPGIKKAVINMDDVFGRELLQGLPGCVEIAGYGLQECSGFQGDMLFATSLRPVKAGMHLTIQTSKGDIELQSALLGQFNASNLLAVLGVLLALGITLEEAALRLNRLQPVPGRMQIYGAGPIAVVDYAHTPAALREALTALRGHCTGRLWCVFGCGGDRDAGKRPLMGRVVEDYADVCIITDDNPRTESPVRIVDDILQGLASPKKATVIHDRREAIHYALEHADSEDMVLIAGKGHESTQLIGTTSQPFSDRDVVAAHFGLDES